VETAARQLLDLQELCAKLEAQLERQTGEPEAADLKLRRFKGHFGANSTTPALLNLTEQCCSTSTGYNLQ
jgi:hypothetical protein